MRFRELNEVDIPNSADRAERTLSDLGAMAKRAIGSFRDAHAQATGTIKAQAEKAATDAADEKTAANNAKGDVTGSISAAPATIASIVLTRQPEENDLPEVDGLNASQFNNVLTALDKMTIRLEKFSKNFARLLKEADFVNDLDRKEIPERLADRSKKMVDSADTLLSADQNGEHDAWTIALTNDDLDVGGNSLIDLIHSMAEKNAAANLADTGKNGGRKVVRASGMNLINMTGAQMYIISQRLAMLKPLLIRLAGQPIKPALTTEHLKRLGQLAKLM